MQVQKTKAAAERQFLIIWKDVVFDAACGTESKHGHRRYRVHGSADTGNHTEPNRTLVHCGL